MIDESQRRLLLHPPVETSSLPGIGGRLRMQPEDFVVDEVPAYSPDGTPDRHLFLRLEKRGLSTDEAVREICVQTGVSRGEVGVAGKKDKHALTRQWISLPASAEVELGRFSHPDVRILEVRGHRHKLRRGHNRGNRFEIVVRDLDCDPNCALRRSEVKAAAIERRRGILGFFGEQRFGRDGENLDRGLDALRAGRKAAIFELSAGQSALFNLLLLRRQHHDLVDRVLAGDLVQKTDTGGMFEVEDVEVEQGRLDAGELVVTGPIFGAKTRRPSERSAARELEDACLSEAAVEEERLKAYGKKLPGSRRPLRTPVVGLMLSIESGGELPAGLRLCFELGSGSYATRVLAEFQEGAAAPPKESGT